MKHPNVRIARLKEMIALEEKRSTLLSQIATVDERLSTIQGELYKGGISPVPAPRKLLVPAQKALGKLQSKGKRKGRGELKGQILEILQAAGNTGATVKELANRIGIKAANIHSWFSANLSKLGGLKKVGEARYALNGTSGPVAKPAKKSKVAKAKKGKAIKAKAGKVLKSSKPVVALKIVEKAKTSKAPKVVKTAKAGKPKAVRGQLKEQILDELKNAGAEGLTIKDLAAKLKANYKNVYIWFVTTGKKVGEIKKVGPAQYKWEAAA